MCFVMAWECGAVLMQQYQANKKDACLLLVGAQSCPGSFIGSSLSVLQRNMLLNLWMQGEYKPKN